MNQAAKNVLMIAPVQFGYNPETAVTNVFQNAPEMREAQSAQAKARAEFESLSKALGDYGVHVLQVEDTAEPFTPDSIFPNNWISTHTDGTVAIYPMLAKNRRAERSAAVLSALMNRYCVRRIVDFSAYELSGQIVEGTGSMILDRRNRVLYACFSARTTKELLGHIAKTLNYEVVAFDAKNPDGSEIYHTNVLMNLGAGYAAICLSAIPDLRQREIVRKSLQNSGREILDLSIAQMNAFAGNMLQLGLPEGKLLTVMSKTAHDSLSLEQLAQIASDGPILTAQIPTIEKLGGGSVRCMLAEIWLNPV